MVLAAVLLATAVLAGACGLFGTDLGVDGIDTRWVSVDGQDGRKALLVAPEGAFVGDSGPGGLPAVVVMHGLGGDPETMATMAEWPEAARDHGFLAVFPEGVGDSWNAGGCCGSAVEWGVDDVAFLDALFEQLVVEEGVDPGSLHLTGHSNGAMLAYLYACRRPDALRGAASVAGTNFSDCVPSATPDFMQVSGAEDPVIPVLGGESSLPGLGLVPSVEQSMWDQASAAGCAEPRGVDFGSLVSFQGEGCSSGARIRYDVLDGLGHEYPSAVTSPEYVAVDKIVQFWGLDR